MRRCAALYFAALLFTAPRGRFPKGGDAHVPLKDLTLRSGVLLAAIVRGDTTIIPGGLTTIEEGDRVLVIARSMGLKDLADILA